MNITLATSQLWRAESVDNPPILLVDIFAANLPGSPIRIAPRLGGGGNYDEFALRLVMPDDGDRRQPRARLELANVDRKYIDLAVDHLIGDASVTMSIAAAETPQTIEWSSAMYMDDVEVRGDALAMTLSHAALLERGAVALHFNSATMPVVALGAA